MESQYNNRGGSRILEGEGADLTEQYQNNPRQNHLSDSFVPFLNFKLKRPQREGGWPPPLPGPTPEKSATGLAKCFCYDGGLLHVRQGTFPHTLSLLA